LVPGVRFERTTSPLGGECSIQLSYQGMIGDYNELLE
jgi:hypothetical protein